MADATRLDPATLRWVAEALTTRAKSLRHLSSVVDDASNAEWCFTRQAKLLEGFARRFRARATRAERKAGKGDG